MLQTDGPLWEDRLVRPIDIRPEYRLRHEFERGTPTDPTHFRLQQHFLRIETDDSRHGVAGRCRTWVARYVARRLRPILPEQD